MNQSQAEKEKVETAVRNYLAEKPAEDAIREKELQKSRAETEEVQNELADTQTQRDALQVPPLPPPPTRGFPPPALSFLCPFPCKILSFFLFKLVGVWSSSITAMMLLWIGLRRHHSF